MAAVSGSQQRPAVDPGSSPAPLTVAGEALSGMSDLRRFFRQNRRPIFFIGATDFNLAGMDQWISEFRHICYIDSYDGRHPNVYVPGVADHDEFHSIEDVNNYLLGHKDVIRYIGARGGDPVAVFLMFDEQTEALCEELGMQIWLPPAALRSRLDNKVETVRIGNKAGVPSVPNVLGRVRSYKELQRLAARAGLGSDLVVQAAYGDSGHTTFFIAGRADWRRHAAEITAEPEVKIMKRIDPLGSTLEACVTRAGTIVGPLLTELIGHPELTPYRGGWCGNEMFPDAFSQAQRAQARGYAEKLGDQLLNEGYRGYFDVDFLIDRSDGTVYLGELNPRICGASPITNHGMFAHADVPLFLFHLLEFSGVPFELDIADLNARWADPRFVDSWSEIVLKSGADDVDLVTSAPASGLWRLDAAGTATYTRFDYHRDVVESDGDGLFLRITGPGDYRYKGADLGILITRGRLMTDEFELNDRARAWIAGLSGAYQARALEGPAPAPRATISKML